MIEKPLYQNPLGGGPATLIPNPGAGTVPKGGQQGPFDLSKIDKNPYNTEFIGIGADQTNLFGYKVPDYVIKEQEERMKNNPINNFNVTPPNELELLKPLRPKSDDPLVQGYMDSDFYSNISTTNVVPYTYKGKEVQGSGSYASNFKKYLESIGKGDLIQFPDQGIAQQETGPLATIGFGSGDSRDITSTLPNQGVGQDVFGNNPMEIAVPSIPNSFNRVGQQLTGPNQVGDFNSRLNKIEQGIMTLLGNKRQGFNTGYQPNYGFNIGFGNSFPPFGGMYG
jgi:hypothetical protein